MKQKPTMIHIGTHRDRFKKKQMQRHVDINYLLSFLPSFFPHPPLSVQVLLRLFLHPFSAPQSFWHLLDMFCTSRAFNGLGSPPLLLFRDVILQNTSSAISDGKRCATLREADTCACTSASAQLVIARQSQCQTPLHLSPSILNISYHAHPHS